jgi:hypothetical protein
MAKKTDGHIQFNGQAFQFYLTKQANLKCETADCSTCKEASRAWDKRAADASDAVAQKAKEAEGKRVEVAAGKAQADGEKKVIHDAAAMMNDAIRTAHIAKRKEDLDAETDAALSLAKARAACKEAEQKAQDTMEKRKSKTMEAFNAAVEKAKTTDWLAKVPK